MDEQEYLKDRLEAQINWYDNKSQKNKRYHIISKSIVIIFATMIPFLSGYITAEKRWLIVTISVFGLITAVLTGLSTVFKFQEKWNKYRTTCESLRHEKYLYLTKTGPYQDYRKNSFNEFVLRIEQMISEENSIWLGYIDKDEGFQ